EQQERLELRCEEAGPRRIRERERRERVEHAPAPHPLAEIRLDAENRDDDLGRDAVALARGGDLLGVGAPELDAAPDALRSEKDRAVLVPRQHALRGPRDRLENLLLDLDARE